MLRIISIDVSGARTAWTLFSHSGYGIMFMDGGDPDFVLEIAFTGNELAESAIYLERDGIIHFPANAEFERFYIQHLADTGTIKIAILEKPSMDRPIYRRGGLLESTLNVAQTVDPLPVAETVNPLPVSTEFNDVFQAAITQPSAGQPTGWTNISALCKLTMVKFQLVTNATVANRIATIEIDEGGTDIFTLFAHQIQTASNTVRYVFGYDAEACYRTGSFLQQALIDTILKSSWRFRIAVIAMVGGDQLSAIGYIKQS